ncbi:paraquat-inducible protein A [Asaia bogorensis]|uniref:paraquat-inducible protein A n=1 Tax=Asaia bogorensis TaxID=91915 RepID=UPI000705AB56|nr:paraquat-inducible protein A [Asaia bogorensis]BAT18486.1 paraquat-inducible protein A [Asaia bogorensis NBRC 16594]GBQ74937.1 paraquat-inducible protein A [Asaia bogorensis NBRC 16594]
MSDRFHKRLWRNAVTMASAVPPTPTLKVVEGLRECPDCGLFQTVPRLRRGQVAYCTRCDAQLARRRRTPPIAAPTAFCLASAALYIALLITQLLTINVHGRVNTVTILTGPIELGREGFGEIGLIVGLTTLIMPGVVIALMGAILVGASRRTMPDWAPRLMSWYERLREWSMIEVYILGVFVAYTKLIDLAIVDLQAGVFLIAALMITMAATDSTLDVERIWDNRDIREEMADGQGRILPVEHLTATDDSMPPIQHMLSCHSCGLVMAFDHEVSREGDMGDCPRCHQILRRRKSNSLTNAAALLLAGIICYIPANMLPVMTYTKMGQPDTSTIIHGVIELWQSNLIPLALLVLFASITVPVLKIVSLALMVLGTWRKQKRGLRLLTKLYRLIDIIGRWSMIDVFMISILVAIVHFNFLANVLADPGVVFFTIVVIVTIFAVHSFDPRSMWDAAGENGPVPAPDEARQNSGQGGISEAGSSFPPHDMEPERA